MRVTRSAHAATCEPQPGWRRMSLCNEPDISIERFVKPGGHASPRHSHEQAQALIVLSGTIRVTTDRADELLAAGDAAYFESNEPHIVTNPGPVEAIGLDIFVPGRSFDYWLKRGR